MRAESFLFASSLVLSFSSSVLGTSGGLSFPSGHSPFLKASMKVMTRLSSKNVLRVSRIFLNPPVRKTLDDRRIVGYLSIVPPRTCCSMITIACLLNQLFFLFSSKIAKTKSHMGAVKSDVLDSPSRGFKSPVRFANASSAALFPEALRACATRSSS